MAYWRSGKAGQDQDPGFGVSRTHVAEDVHAAAVRHADVEDQQLPGPLAQAIERLLAGRRLADLPHGRVLGQHLAQAGPDHRMIVCNQDPGAHHG